MTLPVTPHQLHLSLACQDQSYHHHLQLPHLLSNSLDYDEIIQMLVDGTNEHAQMIITAKEAAGELTPGSRWRRWRSANPQEMKAVLAIMLNMGIIHCPDIQSYWKTCNIAFFHDVLRFEAIYWSLHIKTVSTRQRLDKIRPDC